MGKMINISNLLANVPEFTYLYLEAPKQSQTRSTGSKVTDSTWLICNVALLTH